MAPQDNLLTDDQARAIVARNQKGFYADVSTSQSDKPQNIQRITIPLDNGYTDGAPFPINIPFNSILVESATDTSTYVNLKPHTEDSYQGWVKLDQNFAIYFTDAVAKALITAPAQPGKSITLILGIGMEFRPGKNVSQNAGGVSINDGSALTPSVVTGTGDTATQLLASDSNRKTALCQNRSGASIWIGGASVTDSASSANQGVEIIDGAYFDWNNTAPLYAYCRIGLRVALLSQS